MKKTIGILLSGCGVYDGAEIQESVLTMLAIEEIGANYQCISINKNQHHVINHLTGEVMNEERNMQIEAARIARGNVKNTNEITAANIDALVIPGGFGSAKNFTSWAFEGPESTILPEVKLLLVNLVNAGVPVVALCVSPIVLAKAFEDSSIQLNITLGTLEEPSPYDISAFTDGLSKTGMNSEMKNITEILIDKQNRVISAPCYMMDASITEVNSNIRQAIAALKNMLE